MLLNLPIDKLYARPDARSVNPQVVDAIADGLAKGEPIPPLRVRPMGDGWEVTAGNHRLEAHRKLGLTEVPCIVRDDDDTAAEMAMIDENLIREELSAVDRARAMARRRELYQQQHPGSKRGGSLKGHAPREVESFDAQTVRITGMSRESVLQAARRGSKITDEVLSMIRGTPLDNGAYLDKIKDLSPNDQHVAVTRDLRLAQERSAPKRNRRTGSTSRGSISPLARGPAVTNRRKREAAAIAKIITEHVPDELIKKIAKLLRNATASYIADELEK